MKPGACVKLIRFDPETNQPFHQGYRVWWPDVSEEGDGDDNPYFCSWHVGLALADDRSDYTLVLFTTLDGVTRMGWILDEVIEVA